MAKNSGVLSELKIFKPFKRRHSRQYSIVSVSDLTDGAAEVWSGLPTTVRKDPFLASFRQKYERSHGK